MSYQLLSKTEPTARKDYHCIWCPEKILKGQKHVHEVSTYDGDFQDNRWHTECYDAASQHWRQYPDENEFKPQSHQRGTSLEAGAKAIL